MPKVTDSSPASQRVRTLRVLRAAWYEVYANRITSDSSRRTKHEVNLFKESEDTNLRRIQTQLQKKIYKFSPARGSLVDKSSGKKRTVVVPVVQDRVVQRAILDTLQSMPGIDALIQVPTSFGAIKKRRVHDAIVAVVKTIKGGEVTHFLKSDIKDFFPGIPREKVIKTIAPIVGDAEFLDLLGRATYAEVENLSQLEKAYRPYFEFDEVGMPQGCSLTPPTIWQNTAAGA